MEFWFLLKRMSVFISALYMSRLVTKPTKWVCAQQRLRSAWASAQSDQSSLCTQWVDKDSSFLHADSKDTDQTGQMPRLIWVFAGRTTTLLVLSRGGSYHIVGQFYHNYKMKPSLDADLWMWSKTEDPDQLLNSKHCLHSFQLFKLMFWFSCFKDYFQSLLMHKSFETASQGQGKGAD